MIDMTNSAAMQAPMTLPMLLCQRADRTPDAVAFWCKRKGQWRATSWRSYRDQVRNCAVGLDAAGVRHGDAVLLYGEAGPEWLIADLAVQWLGGISVTPYPDGCLDDIALAFRDATPRLVLTDGLESRRHFDAAAIGTIWLRREPGTSGRCLDDLIEANDGEGRQPYPAEAKDVATIAFTAGASGRPRPIALSHRQIIDRAEAVLGVLGNDKGLNALCQVPFAHVAERVCSAAGHLVAGGMLYFVERTDTVALDLEEAAPSQVSALAWQWDHLARSMILKMQDASKLNRMRFERLMRGEATGISGVLMRRSLRRHLGLGRVEKLVCYGESVRAETASLMGALHLPLITAYGITELCGWSLFRRGQGAALSDAGWQALPRQQYRQQDDGELMLASGHAYLPTGDLVTKTADGIELLSRCGTPSERADDELVRRVEREVGLSRHVAHCAIRQWGSSWQTLVAIDPQTTGDWAKRLGHSYTTFHSLTQHPQVQAMIRTEVTGIIEKHMGKGRALELHILTKQLRRDDGTLTASGSLRRSVLDRFHTQSFHLSSRKLNDAVSG